MASRGRPPAPRGVYAFDSDDWQRPESVVLDTNVVAEALLSNQPEHRECLALFRDLANSEIVVVFNRLLEIELSQVIFNVALRERHPKKDLRNIRYDDRIRKRAARLLGNAHEAWDDLKSTLKWSYLELDEVASHVPDLMQSYGLESNDAVHAATAMESGIRDVITRDGGFAKLPPSLATLHTTKARLANTRDRRRRAGY